MEMKSLQATQKILLINWVIAPALALWIWSKDGFFKAVLFLVIWLVVDKVWDLISGLLIAGAGKIGGNEEESIGMETSGDVPANMAFMMIVDLLGTLMLPLIIAGLMLGWFQTLL